jgi:branched-subunit amino acid aminotransferase/4-amino-4-deoxychorismate lyase
VKDGKLFTPPSYTGALPGITAQEVMRLARRLDFEVEEKNITLTNSSTQRKFSSQEQPLK